MSAPSGLVVVGGSIAGVRAIEGARAAGYTGPITLISAEAYAPYDRTSLSKDVLAVDGLADPPALRAEASWAELEVTVRTSTTAVGLDRSAKVVHTNGDPVGYDQLIIATGGSARALPQLPHSHVMRTSDDAHAIRKALDSGEEFIVVGAGFIGAEIATAARARGARVTVIDAAEFPLGRAVGPMGGQALVALHHDGGVDLRLGTTITSGDEHSSTLSDGSTLTPHATFVGIGAVPATGWLAESGIRLDPATKAVAVDRTLSTNDPCVHAAGDAAMVEGELGQHWVAASDQGRIAGANAVSAQAQEWHAIPFAWSHWYGHRVQYIGECRGPLEVSVNSDGVSGTILSHDGERFLGALAINRPADAAKSRRLIAAGSSWADARAGFEPTPSA